MSNDSSHAGFDAPADRNADVLGRWRFAQQIVRVALDAPPDWSVRIGVYGEWGSGKTTVLNFVGEQVASEGHIAVRLNPWHAENPTALWTSFVNALHAAADHAGLKISKTTKKLVQKHFDAIGKLALTAITAANEKAGKALESVADVLGVGTLLRIGRNEAESLAKEAGDRRFVVLVDDLDRAEPSLVPRVLFALKEVLDVGGFSFVLGFDPKVVSAIVHGHFTTQALGGDFLEKIIDFPRPLPAPTARQLEALAMRERSERCLFVNAEALARTLPFVSRSPRRIKRFVQGLYFLRSEINRHKADELNWDVLLLCCALHNFDRTLTDALFRGGPKSVFATFRASRWTLRDQRREEHALSALKELQSFASTYAEQFTDEVVQIVQALSQVDGGLIALDTYTYYADLLDRPHALTWMEFDAFIEGWSRTQSLAAIQEWVAKQAEKRSVAVDDVLRELWSSALQHYSRQLGHAADSRTVRRQSVSVEDASRTLTLIGQLGIESRLFATPNPCFGETEFRQMFHALAGFAHFSKPETYIPLRQAEKELLIAVCTSAGADPRVLLRALKPWHFPDIDEELSALHSATVDALAPQIMERFLASFEIPHAVAPSLLIGDDEPITYIVIHTAAQAWSAQHLERLRSLATLASQNPVIHENFIDFFRRLELFSSRGSLRASATGSPVAQLVQISWAGAIAEPLQYRMLGALEDDRRSLSVAFDVELALPAWWEELGRAVTSEGPRPGSSDSSDR